MTQFIVCKKLFVFDWDGTILDSMPIKFRNFSRVLVELINRVSPVQVVVEDVLNVYREFSGLSRRVIFDKTLEILACDGNVDYSEFNNTLAERNIQDLKQAEIFEDAQNILKLLQEKDIPFCISSSSPSQELLEITRSKIAQGLIPKPEHILGSHDGFRKGPEHLCFLKAQYAGLSYHDVIFFGDEIQDYELCQLVDGVDVFVIDREDRFADKAFNTIDSFNQLEIVQ